MPRAFLPLAICLAHVGRRLLILGTMAVLIGCDRTSLPQLAGSSGAERGADGHELAIRSISPITLTASRRDEECEVAHAVLEYLVPIFAKHEQSVLILQTESADARVSAYVLQKNTQHDIDLDAVKRLKDASKEVRAWPPDLITSRRLHLMDEMNVMRIMADEKESKQIEQEVGHCGIIRMSRPAFDANHERAHIWWEFSQGAESGSLEAMHALRKTDKGWEIDGLPWTMIGCPFKAAGAK